MLLLCLLFPDFLHWGLPVEVSKPREARFYDLALNIVELFISLGHQKWGHLIPATIHTSRAGLLFKCLRAFAVAKYVPYSRVKIPLDRFNFVGPGLVSALTSVLVLITGCRESSRR
jgi:hypothetical protein